MLLRRRKPARHDSGCLAVAAVYDDPATAALSAVADWPLQWQGEVERHTLFGIPGGQLPATVSLDCISTFVQAALVKTRLFWAHEATP